VTLPAEPDPEVNRKNVAVAVVPIRNAVADY
jgi:hypothetical protein